MPRPKRTQEAITLMQNRILDATNELVYEEGPASVTVRRIASRLGVSHMTLYNYFDDRDAILEGVSRRYFEEIASLRCQQLERGKEGQVIEVMREELIHLASQIRDRPELFRLMVQSMLSGEHKDETCPLRLKQQEYVDHLAKLIEIGNAQGTMNILQPQLAALSITAAVCGPLVLLVSYWMNNEARFWEVYTQLIDTITNSLRVS